MATFAETMLAKSACGGQVRDAPRDGGRREALRRPAVVHAGRSGGPAFVWAIHPSRGAGGLFPGRRPFPNPDSRPLAVPRLFFCRCK